MELLENEFDQMVFCSHCEEPIEVGFVSDGPPLCDDCRDELSGVNDEIQNDMMMDEMGDDA